MEGGNVIFLWAFKALLIFANTVSCFLWIQIYQTFHNLLNVFADSLPLGSYCSFELGSCGWLVPDSQSSWRLVSGQQLNEDTELLGTTLQNTQGECETWSSMSHCIGYPSEFPFSRHSNIEKSYRVCMVVYTFVEFIIYIICE